MGVSCHHLKVCSLSESNGQMQFVIFEQLYGSKAYSILSIKNGWKLNHQKYSINWFEGDVSPPTLLSMASESPDVDANSSQDSENEAESDFGSDTDDNTDSDDSSSDEN